MVLNCAILGVKFVLPTGCVYIFPMLDVASWLSTETPCLSVYKTDWYDLSRTSFTLVLTVHVLCELLFGYLTTSSKFLNTACNRGIRHTTNSLDFSFFALMVYSHWTILSHSQSSIMSSDSIQGNSCQTLRKYLERCRWMLRTCTGWAVEKNTSWWVYLELCKNLWVEEREDYHLFKGLDVFIQTSNTFKGDLWRSREVSYITQCLFPNEKTINLATSKHVKATFSLDIILPVRQAS